PAAPGRDESPGSCDAVRAVVFVLAGLVLVAVGHAVADGAVRRLAPDVGRKPEGRIPGAVRRSGVWRVRHGARACAIHDWLVATLDARSGRTMAGGLHAPAAAVAGRNHGRVRALVGRQRPSRSRTG